jgi:hypothetical protein
MDRLPDALLRVGDRLQRLLQLMALLLAVGSGVGALGARLDWGDFFDLLGTYALIMSLSATWIVLILIGIWVWQIRSQFSTGFVDNPRQAINQQWDFVGPWSRSKQGDLVVTGSDQGGLTKRGANWENYSITFEACIVNGCLGVIVRALDPNNYYMLQISRDSIRPHRRVLVPIVPDTVEAKDEQRVPEKQVISRVIWVVGESTPLAKATNDWFKVKVTVNGETLDMSIDGRPVLYAAAFLKNPVGKVGFRNDGAEQAFVRKTRVRLERSASSSR